MIERWNDDGNGVVDKGEILGDIGNSVDGRNVGMRIYMPGSSFSPVTYTLLDSGDNVISRTYCPKKKSILLREKLLPSGKYKFVAQRNDSVATREFEITE